MNIYITFIVAGVGWGDVHTGDTWHLVLGGGQTDAMIRGHSGLALPQAVSPFINEGKEPVRPPPRTVGAGRGPTRLWFATLKPWLECLTLGRRLPYCVGGQEGCGHSGRRVRVASVFPLPHCRPPWRAPVWGKLVAPVSDPKDPRALFEIQSWASFPVPVHLQVPSVLSKFLKLFWLKWLLLKVAWERPLSSILGGRARTRVVRVGRGRRCWKLGWPAWTPTCCDPGKLRPSRDGLPHEMWWGYMHVGRDMKSPAHSKHSADVSSLSVSKTRSLVSPCKCSLQKQSFVPGVGNLRGNPNSLKAQEHSHLHRCIRTLCTSWPDTRSVGLQAKAVWWWKL